ncbi:hypothetical protein TorRG33x02_292080 [Trema orientale]|uniref:Uncharacterized protein n=1 Tax=Trema orientale TaxID=63057 RepID=A0A2P5CAK0_TREOI|nr:hypothetical protein TorRG33x02_292080 [Trema orientale]
MVHYRIWILPQRVEPLEKICKMCKDWFPDAFLGRRQSAAKDSGKRVELLDTFVHKGIVTDDITNHIIPI